MNASYNIKSGSSIEQQLSSIQMSEHQRQAALNAASVAELFADAIVWVCRRVPRPDLDLFARPDLRYWD